VSGDADAGAVPPQGPRPRRGGRGRVAAVAVVAVVAVGAGIVIADPFSAKPKSGSVDSSAPTGLAKVTQGTLSARTLQSGTLGYAGDDSVISKVSGTATELPSPGQVIDQGQPLYKVDGKPVIFLQGAYVPVYREPSRGMKGSDVKQLNADLVALGYASKSDLDPGSSYFSWATYYALEKLQHAVGLTETGDLPLGQAVFLPAAHVRVIKVNMVRGGSVMTGGVVMEVSSSARQVTVSLDANSQSTVAVGDKVTITMPDGTTTPGVVSSVGKVAMKSTTGTTVEVLIRPLKPQVTGKLDQAPVQVSITTESAQNVLSVPVNALLALAGGGYAVEVVDPGGAHRLVAVTTGLFDDSAGTVQVSGAGLQVGQNVVVPAS
jgi:hypothetical protein